MTSDSEECVDMKQTQNFNKDIAVVITDWKMTRKVPRKV